jgi:hypothetical protein
MSRLLGTNYFRHVDWSTGEYILYGIIFTILFLYGCYLAHRKANPKKKEMSGDLQDRITEHVKSALHTAYNEKGIEAAIASLKENGFSQLQSVYILTTELNLSFADANRFMMHSDAWK